MQVTRDLLLDLNLLRELPKRVNTSAKVFAFAAHLSQRWLRVSPVSFILGYSRGLVSARKHASE